jgi:glucosamine 6-phosphate synthetase-like amidotransferase/phosphosugar isomerase protein
MEHLCLVFVMLWVLQFLEKLTQEHTAVGPEISCIYQSVYTNYSINHDCFAFKKQRRHGDFHMYLGTSYSEKLRALKPMQKSKRDCFNIQGCSNCLYLGRGYNRFFRRRFKVKRDLHIHSPEGYPCWNEHSPIALIDESMPVVIAQNKGIMTKL